MNREKVVSELIDILRRVSPTDLELSEATEIVKDIGLESIQVIEFLCEVEDYFEIVINEETIGKVQCFGDLADVIKGLKDG